VNLDAAGKRALGVTYVDSRGREFEQPAEMVLLCSYVLNNVRLMLLSGIGKPYDPAANTGVVGRNYAYQTPSSVTLFFEDRVFNQFMAAGGMGITIDEFNGDNFDHSGLGFIGGGFLQAATSGSRRSRCVRCRAARRAGPGMEARGGGNTSTVVPITIQAPARAIAALPRSGSTYRDAYGLPLLRLTFDRARTSTRCRCGSPTRRADREGDRAVEDERHPGTENTPSSPTRSTHNTGGAIMGADRRPALSTSICQSWAVPNIFVVGAERVSAERRLQPDGDRRRPHLLGAGGDHEPLPRRVPAARRLAPQSQKYRPPRWRPSAAGRRRSACLRQRELLALQEHLRCRPRP